MNPTDEASTAEFERETQDANMLAVAEFGSRPLPKILEQIDASPLGELRQLLVDAEEGEKIARTRAAESRYAATVVADRLREIVKTYQGDVGVAVVAREIDTSPEFVDPPRDAAETDAEYQAIGDWGSPQEGDRPAPVMLDRPVPAADDVHPTQPTETRARIQADTAAMTRLAQAGRVAEQRSRAAGRSVVTNLDSGSEAHEVATVQRLAHQGWTADEDERQAAIGDWDRR